MKAVGILITGTIISLLSGMNLFSTVQAGYKAIPFQHSEQQFDAKRTFQITMADLDRDGDLDAV